MNKTVFVHIPKTGGMSIRRALTSAEVPCLRYGIRGDRADDAAINKALRDSTTEVVIGHFHNRGGYFGHLRRHASAMVTMLRHPVERVYSLYRYSLQRENPMTPFAKSGLPAFVRAKRREVRNWQAAQLAGDGFKLNGVLYAEAMCALAQFDLVGVTERFEALLRAFGETIGHELSLRHDNRLRPKGAAPLTEPIRSIILAHNTVDLALWREATRRAPS